MKLLITGASGFLGRRAAAHFTHLGYQVLTPSHADLDITREDAVLDWFRKNRPEICRGQLAENFFKHRNELPDYLRFILTHCLYNIAAVPDFIAYSFEDRNDSISVKLCRKLWKAQGVSWTIRTKEDYDIAVAEGLLPIFEYFTP